MANIVVGAFTTESEAAAAVHDLEIKGYDAENVTMLMNRPASKKLEEHTNVHVEDSLYNRDASETFWDKIKRGFLQDVGPNDTLTPFDMLVSYGLSEEQAEEYAHVLETGNIIVIASEGKREEHRRLAPIADDNIDSLDRTGRTNLEDEHLGSDSEYQHIVADDQEPSDENGQNRLDNEERNKKKETEGEKKTDEEKVLDENPVLNKSTQERDGRSI